MRVLVVDDNADAADSLALLLSQMGHETRVVYDGEAALDQLRSGWAQVALLDIGMPGVSGYEVALRTRAIEFAEPPVLVAVTGWGRAEDRRRARAAGFAHHLTKPVDFDVLVDLLGAVHARG